MSYYVFGQPKEGAGRPVARVAPTAERSRGWTTGQRFAHPPENPIELYWESDTEGGETFDFYDGSPPLMRDRLVAALKECGVDSFDEYAVVIRSSTGRQDRRDYLAVNVVGMVAAADMARSDIEDRSDGLVDVLFGSLAIDGVKARDLLLFRLAQSAQTLLVHERVAKRLSGRNGLSVEFSRADGYSG